MTGSAKDALDEENEEESARWNRVKAGNREDIRNREKFFLTCLLEGKIKSDAKNDGDLDPGDLHGWKIKGIANSSQAVL